MANELVLDLPTLSGSILYAHLIRGGQKWNGSAYENVVAANWTNYTVAMTESGIGTGFFVGTIPSGAGPTIGPIDFSVFKRVGGTPATTDPLVSIGTYDPVPSRLAGMLQADGSGGYQFTILALARAPGGSLVGPGSESVTITVNNSDNQPIGNVQVWISTDAAGNDVIAGTLLTDDFGVVEFLLDPGSYYVWREHPSYVFVNPQALTVS
jgi:hypothetical protein